MKPLFLPHYKKIFVPIPFGSCIAGAAELQDAYFSYGFWEFVRRHFCAACRFFYSPIISPFP